MAPQPATTERRTSRTTRQGVAIDHVLSEAQVFLSAQDIHARLRASGDAVGLATVYRHVQRLVEEGTIDAVQGADGQLEYRRCASGQHHHHLVCRRCRRSTELESGEVERWAASQAATRGYTDVEHTVELFGICEQCRG